MKLNIHILFDELMDYSPQLATSRGIDLALSQIRLAQLPESSLRQDCIYLLDASTIEAHALLLRDVDLISIGHIDTQKEVLSNLSVISIPASCDKADIFNKVQDIFERYGQWDYGLMRSIAANEPLQTIADRAAAILANPFALLDITLSKILIGGSVPSNYKGSVWEVMLNEGYTPSETYALSPDELYFFTAYNTKPYFIDAAPYPHHSHIMANLYLDDKSFAFLATTDSNAPLTQGQLSLLKHVRDIMELAIAASIELKGSAGTVTYYLEALLKGFPADEKIISYHLAEIGWSINDHFRLYTIANPDGKKLRESQAEFCIFRIKKLREDVISFSYENFIIVITRQSNNEANKNYQKDLTNLISKLGLHSGCSHTFDHFNDLKYYYIQSKAALRAGEDANSEGVLWNFGDLYFPHMVRLLQNSTSLKSMCHPNVLRLLEHDNACGTDYVQCMRTYLFNGCNIAQTGKGLYMHRNTLIYRLDKIEEIIEMDVRELCENERMQLWFSCVICKFF